MHYAVSQQLGKTDKNYLILLFQLDLHHNVEESHSTLDTDLRAQNYVFNLSGLQMFVSIKRVESTFGPNENSR